VTVEFLRGDNPPIPLADTSNSRFVDLACIELRSMSERLRGRHCRNRDARSDRGQPDLGRFLSRAERLLNSGAMDCERARHNR